MQSSEQTFASLLNVEGNQWHYHIPRFQREYVWGKDNWSKLLDDINEDDSGHYMGAIICVQDTQEASPTSELIYEVVDGQQRLTTLSLLLCAIYHHMQTLAKQTPDLEKSEDFIIHRSNIRKRLIKEVAGPADIRWGVFNSDDKAFCLRVQPSTQGHNLEDYLYILHEIGVLPEAVRPPYLGNRRMYKAFVYFRENIGSNWDEILNLVKLINALVFIHITEGSQSKAYMLFETLNYRGVPLSAIDIIKNKILSTLECRHNVGIESAYDKWLKLLNWLPADQHQNRFLRQYYNAFKTRADIKVEGATIARSSNVIKIYEKLIKSNALNLLEDLIAKAQTYNNFFEPDESHDPELGRALVDLQRIGATPAYTFLLYLFSLSANDFAEDNVILRTVKLLAKYYFRRNVTDLPRTRALDAINIELVERCERERKERPLSWEFVRKIVLSGKGKPPSLNELRKALADNLYANNDYMARYALTKLDEISHTREYAPDLWARNERGVLMWSVEHILPQGRNLPDEWVAMIADSNRERAEEVQNRWVHCLGNLTLTAYNSRLSNQPFEKKQRKNEVTVFGNKIHIGYKNGLALNKIPFMVDGNTVTLATTDRWTHEHIEARNKAMVDMLVNMFTFEGE